MALFNEPAQWDHTLGNNADTSTLPDDAAATAGIASLQKLFQIINATPLEAGGIAPAREDVNALFKYLGDQIFYTQNGGVSSYNAAYDYVAGRVVLYNGNLYKCIQANGVSGTVVTPDSNTAYWQRLDNFVRSVNGVTADAKGNVQTGFPSDTFVTIFENITNNAMSAPEAYVNSYTAPANGYVHCGGAKNPNVRESACYITTNRIASRYSSGTLASVATSLMVGGTIPVKKGDVVSFLIYNLQNASATFIYAEGEI